MVEGGGNLQRYYSKSASRSEKPQVLRGFNESPVARPRAWKQEDLERDRKCHLAMQNSSLAPFKFYSPDYRIQCHKQRVRKAPG